jgi:hypothetical protein
MRSERWSPGQGEREAEGRITETREERSCQSALSLPGGALRALAPPAGTGRDSKVQTSRTRDSVRPGSRG